jgi:hypothetical protein
LRDHPHFSPGDVPATAFDPELWKPSLERIVCEL